MTIPRRQFAFAASSSGRSYAIGGIDDDGNELFDVEYYDSDLDQWIQIVGIPEARSASSAVGDDNGNVLVFGGAINGTIADTVFCYVAIEDSWVKLTPMPVPVRNSVAVFSGGSFFVLGGTSMDGPVAIVQVYDLATGIWSVGTDLPEARYSHAAVVDALERIFVIGGYDINVKRHRPFTTVNA